LFRTLIVEDNASFRYSLSELLSERFPCMVIDEAVDGAEALAKLAAQPPELIFMDIKLPDANGLELTRMIRTEDTVSVIVVLTSHDIPEYWEAAFQAGANYFISKSASVARDIVDLVDYAFPTVCH
ncbi:MAG: response regulator transcription factor, partial [Gallionellaceae bacterium]|nr:response regulator transcription factor [Gallionellaceae bacterium]